MRSPAGRAGVASNPSTTMVKGRHCRTRQSCRARWRLRRTSCSIPRVRKIPASWRVLQRTQLESSKAMRRVRIAAVRTPGRQIDPVESASVARLRYITQSVAPGIRRVGSPKRFRYILENGKPVDRATAERARALGIPPAWRNVWICPDPNGHLQATGRDARGRKQYRYHPRWRVVRDETKFGRLAAFGRALPRIRARTASDPDGA